MGRSWLLPGTLTLAFGAVAGCAAVLGIDDGVPREGGAADSGLDAAQPDASTDAKASDAADAGSPMCDIDAAFGAPTPFAKLDTASQEAHGRLLANELTMVFQSNRDGGVGGVDVYMATRPTIGDTWSGITDLAAVSTTTADNDPALSGDALTLYLAHGGEIYGATRPTATGTFGAPAPLAAVNSAASDFAPYALPGGSKLYLSSARNSDAGVSSLFVALATDGGFSAAAPVGGTGLGAGDNRFAAVTADDLVMYFSSNRGGTGTQGGFDVFVATRASTSVPFSAPRVVPEVSSVGDETPDWVSDDRCRLYFSSNRNTANGYDLYVATKTPP